MILLTGGNGQLGTELQHLLNEQGQEFVATDVKELDITDAQATMDYIQKLRPSIIYHCAAYTAVDKAEDGEYAVDAPTNPLNEYGRTKLLGEQAVAEIMERYYIIRTSWVFGQYGHNFVFTMQRLAETHPKLTVVNDQFGRPTWTRTLAEFMTFAVEKQAPYGVYHLSNDNSCSWYEFAKEILKDTAVDVQPVTSAEYPQKAVRPQYAVMDLSKTKALGFEIPTWEEALAGMLAHGK